MMGRYRSLILVAIAGIIGIAIGAALHMRDQALFGFLESEITVGAPTEHMPAEPAVAPTLEDMPVRDGQYFEEVPAPLGEVPLAAWGTYGQTLKGAFSGEPNYNGRYMLLSMPCTPAPQGTGGCVAGFMFDAESGEFVAAMVGKSLSFSLDSMLLIAESLFGESGSQREFYTIRGGTLSLIGIESNGEYRPIAESECVLAPRTGKSAILNDERTFPGTCSLWPGYQHVREAPTWPAD